MPLAIFGINNDGANLVVNLLVLFLVVLWLALIVWTYFDARRRLDDQMLVACSMACSLFPFLGTVVYTVLRPPEYREDAHERELEIQAAELRVRHLQEQSCPHCEYPIEKSYLRCPSCQRRLRHPCPSCGKPLDPRWRLCPYCEAEAPRAQRKAKPSRPQGKAEPRQAQRVAREKPSRAARKAQRAEEKASGSAPEQASDPRRRKASARGSRKSDDAGEGDGRGRPAPQEESAPDRAEERGEGRSRPARTRR
jgi:double zinc ribbon protein